MTQLLRLMRIQDLRESFFEVFHQESQYPVRGELVGQNERSLFWIMPDDTRRQIAIYRGEPVEEVQVAMEQLRVWCKTIGGMPGPTFEHCPT